MLPEIQTIQTKDNIISRFLGLNQKDTSNDEMFKDMQNMTSDEYPYLSPRESSAIRNILEQSNFNCKGSVVYGEDIYTVLLQPRAGTINFYKNFEVVQGVTLDSTNTGQRQLKVFGAYIVIFPDNVLYNTQDNTVTNMSYEVDFVASDSNKMYLSDKDGVPFLLDQTTYNSEQTGDLPFKGILAGTDHNVRTKDAKISNHIAYNYFKDEYCKFTGTRTQEYTGQQPLTLYKANLLFNIKTDIMTDPDETEKNNNYKETTYPCYWIEKTGNEYSIKRFQEQNRAWYPADLYVSWRVTTTQYETIKDKIHIGDYIRLHPLKSDNSEYTEDDFDGKEATWNLIKTFSNGIKVENIITGSGAVVLVFSNASLNFLKVLKEGKNRFVWRYFPGEGSARAFNELTQMWNAMYFPGGTADNSLGYKMRLERTVPEMDYITVSANRIWGCSSDNHEIYACKQGDATSWYQYAGLASDSYAVTIPNGDPFTGAVTYSDMPYFFTENMAYSIMGNKPKNYQVQNYTLRGVEDGAYRTIAQKDGYVYYKSKSGIERFNGNNAQSLTEYLDMEGLNGYNGATNNDKYFVFLGTSEGQDLYVYDIKKRLWHKDRHETPAELLELDNNLYMITLYDGNLDLVKINGHAKEVADILTDNDITYDTVKWWVKSGEFNGDSVLNKYITKFMFELKLEQGSNLSIYFMYNDSGEWEEVFRTTDRHVKRLVKVPIKVRRCERMRYKIEGKGKCKIYTTTTTFEGGSEIG